MPLSDQTRPNLPYSLALEPLPSFASRVNYAYAGVIMVESTTRSLVTQEGLSEPNSPVTSRYLGRRI